MPSPTYSPTDIGAAVVTLIMVVLDVLAGTGVIPVLDGPTRNALVTALTVLAVTGAAAYVANRRVKHQTIAQVATATATAVHTPTPPSQPFAGGSFVITPVPAPGTGTQTISVAAETPATNLGPTGTGLPS